MAQHGSSESVRVLTILLQKEDPFQGPRMGSCLTLRNELSEETHGLTMQEALLGSGAQLENNRVREPRRTALPCASQSGFIGMELVSGLSLTTHLSWPVLGLTQGPSWWPAHLPAKMHSSAKDPGEVGCLLPPVGLSLILLVSLQGCTLFLIRASCHHASGYCRAWPSWAISVKGPVAVCRQHECVRLFLEAEPYYIFGAFSLFICSSDCKFVLRWRPSDFDLRDKNHLFFLELYLC